MSPSEAAIAKAEQKYALLPVKPPTTTLSQYYRKKRSLSEIRHRPFPDEHHLTKGLAQAKEEFNRMQRPKDR